MTIFTRPAAPDTPATGTPGGSGEGGSGPAPPAGGEPGSVLRSAPRRARRRWWWVLVAAIVAAGSLVAVDVTSAPAAYPLGAVFAKAPGLFPGAAVEVLGVRVGTVTSVHNVDDSVRVGLSVDNGRPIPAGARASLVEPELLGEPDIELDPGYTGGPALASGAVIPESRTAVPVSTEQLLKSLQRTLDAVNPHAVGDLITNLAQDLNGQGQGLNKLIAGAAGTLTLLAAKTDDLGQLSGALAQLTGTLDSRTSEISKLITDYDTVSGVIAQHGGQLGDSITQLSRASTQIVQLLTPNLGSLEQDVGTITTVGRTLDRNLGNVDQTFRSATALFAAAQRAYTPTHNWLTLNLQAPAGVTGAYVAGLVRDRLAGVCRRVAAHHASGLSPAQLQTLAQCGNPSSGFFDPIIDQIPAILNAVASGTAPPSAPSPAAMLGQGLAEIPGLPQGPSGSAAGSSTPSPAAPGLGTAPTTTTTAPPAGSSGGTGSSPCLGGLLGSTLQCSSGSGGSGAGGSGAGSSTNGSGGSGSGGSSGGLGGLLSYRRPLGSAASGTPGPAPALRTSGLGVLPPLPRTAPGAGHGHAGHGHAGHGHGHGRRHGRPGRALGRAAGRAGPVAGPVTGRQPAGAGR
ncbi:MAG: MCE family protein [Acidimicrobiales bacterium]